MISPRREHHVINHVIKKLTPRINAETKDFERVPDLTTAAMVLASVLRNRQM